MYSFDRYRTTPPSSEIEEILVPWADPVVVGEGVIRGESADVVRDLVNTPASDLTPLDLARYCSEAAATYGFDCRVISGEELSESGFGGIVAVGKGSVNAPALIELRYRLDGRPPVCLVGKGITFDTGGLSLKSIAGMLPMKQDMAGAASVLAAVIAAARLGLDLPIRAVLACAENQPGPGAVMPGDIITHRGGKTSEVRDPDAEGRLVVADALALVAEEEPECVVDVTTLTGSTGLGTDLWGVMANAPQLARELVDAGERAGEPGWELPLWAGYRGDILSEIADVKNMYPPPRYNASAILGGLYLQEFIGDHPWAHIDMCAQAFEENDDRTMPIGATGNPTQALIEFLLGRARAQAPGSGAAAPGTSQ
jgi:leucyl aminopeptidase